MSKAPPRIVVDGRCVDAALAAPESDRDRSADGEAGRRAERMVDDSAAWTVPPYRGTVTPAALRAAPWLDFAVDGDPVPQGSVRSFRRGIRPVVVHHRAVDLDAWRRAIAERCSTAIGTPGLLAAGPLSVSLAFAIRRPRGQYGAGGTVASRFAGSLPAVAPDVDKLARAVLDAMAGIAYRDDGQVVDLRAAKAYSDRPGLHVEVRRLDDESLANPKRQRPSRPDVARGTEP